MDAQLAPVALDDCTALAELVAAETSMACISRLHVIKAGMGTTQGMLGIVSNQIEGLGLHAIDRRADMLAVEDMRRLQTKELLVTADWEAP